MIRWHYFTFSSRSPVAGASIFFNICISKLSWRAYKVRERKLDEEVEDAVADVAHYACLLLKVEYLYVDIFSKAKHQIK